MNHLSNEIASANQMIAEAINAILDSLPTIMKQTNLQIEKLEEFMVSMRQLKTAIGDSMSNTNSSGNTHLEAVVDLSYTALSHLQFQDPMIQKLEKIDHLVAEVHSGLFPGFNPEDTPDEASQPLVQETEESDEGSAGQDAGEVMLF